MQRKDKTRFEVVVAVGLGFILVAIALIAPGDIDDRGLWYARYHMEAPQEQMQTLAAMLRDYRDRHGRYPTQEEGLAALEGFQTIGHVRPDPNEASRLGAWWGGYAPQRAREWLAQSRQEEDGVEFPVYTSLIGLQADANSPLRLAADPNDQLFLLGRHGVYSPFGVPYVYENRRGKDAAAYAPSPVETEKADRYTVKVDEGVYLWSAGAMVMSDQYDRAWGRYYGPQIFKAVAYPLVAIGGLLLLGLWVRRKLLAVTVIIATGASLFLSQTVRATCYIMTNGFRTYSPAAARRQAKLLEQYRASGAISPEVYRKLTQSLNVSPDGRE